MNRCFLRSALKNELWVVHGSSVSLWCYASGSVGDTTDNKWFCPQEADILVRGEKKKLFKK